MFFSIKLNDWGVYMGIYGANRNTLRITGMASGLDTDEMVKKMMMAEKMKMDKITQQREYTSWKQEAYVNTIKDMKEIESEFLDVLASKDKSVMSSSAYAGSKITSDNKNIATATSLAGAVNGVYKIKVNRLAETAKKQSTSKLVNKNDAVKDVNLSTKLSDIKRTDDSDSGIPDHFGGADSFTIKIKVGDSTSKNITVKKDDTLNDLINNIYNTKINDNETLYSKIKVSFSELTGKLTIETRNTGKDQNIQLINTDGTSTDTDDTTGVGKFKNIFGIGAAKDEGVDAKVEIKQPNGAVFIPVTKSSNTFTIDSITYNIKDAQSAEEVTLNVEPDATASVEKIEKFLEKYNKLVGKIEGMLKEKKQYSYTPLTSEQKEGMKEDEIEKWEKEAKQGILRNDMNLQNMLTSMRNSFFDKVNGAGLTLAELGLDTSSDTTKGGQIVLDAEGKQKLKKAIETRGDQVMRIFTQSSDVSYDYNMTKENRKERYDENGIFQRIKDIIKDYSGSEGILVKKAGYENSRFAINNDLSKAIKKQDKTIKEMQMKLYRKEDTYYQMFAKLETAMNQMNAQSSWLASQLGGGM